MLHPIRPAAENELRRVLNFQRKVLGLACRSGLTVTQNRTGKVSFVRSQVDWHFGVKAEADWFIRHTSLHKPVAELNAAVTAEPGLAHKIAAAFENDIAFDAHLDDPDYTFACCRLDRGVREQVSALLIMFYTLLGKNGGFSPELTGSGVLTLDRVVQGFWRLNSEIKVCPACDGARPDETKGNVHSQCDHHLPKSKYASLSVHPLNLVPICTDCNLTFKGDQDANEKAHLSEMFLPYMREAFGPLAVQAFRDRQGELCMRFLDRGATNTPRLQALDHILQLQERWTDRLRNRVSDSIVDSLRHQLRSAQRRGETESDFLDNVAAQREGAYESRGKRPDAILREAYFSLIEADPNECVALSA